MTYKELLARQKIAELMQTSDISYWCRLDIPEGTWREITPQKYFMLVAKNCFGGMVQIKALPAQ